MNDQRSIEPADTAWCGKPHRMSPAPRGGPGAWPLVVIAAGAAVVGGCVSVKAPDQPIVIELNINIKQEVVYRLAEDAGNTIEQNPEIF